MPPAGAGCSQASFDGYVVTAIAAPMGLIKRWLVELSVGYKTSNPLSLSQWLDEKQERDKRAKFLQRAWYRYGDVHLFNA